MQIVFYTKATKGDNLFIIMMVVQAIYCMDNMSFFGGNYYFQDDMVGNQVLRSGQPNPAGYYLMVH